MLLAKAWTKKFVVTVDDKLTYNPVITPATEALILNWINTRKDKEEYGPKKVLADQLPSNLQWMIEKLRKVGAKEFHVFNETQGIKP